MMSDLLETLTPATPFCQVQVQYSKFLYTYSTVQYILVIIEFILETLTPATPFVQYSSVQYSTVSTVSTVQYITVQYSIVQYSAV